MIEIARIYDKKQPEGYRILVDRIWPRGVTKEEARLDLWLKDVAPSSDLRRWFGHDPAKWKEFEKRYFKELNAKQEDTQIILDYAKEKDVVLLYAAKDIKHNNAVALKEYLEQSKKRKV